MTKIDRKAPNLFVGSSQPLTYVVFFTAVLILFPAGLLFYENYTEIKNLKQGNFSLVCYLSDGYKLIHPSKIIDKIDDTYIFTNGHASNCQIFKTPYDSLEK